jgi:hypothetical protein
LESEPLSCARCGALLPEGATECVTCGAPVPTLPAAQGRPPPDPSLAGSDLTRRVARLQQWAEASEPLDVALPNLPAWAEEAARNSSLTEPWMEVVRGIERLAQRRIVSALEAWEKQARLRLARLEAYAVDGRVERDQIEDVLHAARAGEVTQALQTYHQVDRVVALKERHLDQAREELERLISLLRDGLRGARARAARRAPRRPEAAAPGAPSPGDHPTARRRPGVRHALRRAVGPGAERRDPRGAGSGRARSRRSGVLEGPPGGGPPPAADPGAGARQRARPVGPGPVDGRR